MTFDFLSVLSSHSPVSSHSLIVSGSHSQFTAPSRPRLHAATSTTATEVLTLNLSVLIASRYIDSRYNTTATAVERMVETLFEDIFRVDQLDPDGKKFDRVNRIEARSDQFDMYMLLDVNTEVYPMHVGEKFMMVLASTLNLDGTPDSGFFSPEGRFSKLLPEPTSTSI